MCVDQGRLTMVKLGGSPIIIIVILIIIKNIDLVKNTNRPFLHTNFQFMMTFL